MADMWNKYEPTAARKRGKPGREIRPKSLTVDMHAHVAVPRAAEIVADYSAFECPNVFVVGYGMDLAHRFRELPFVGRLVRD